MKLLIITQKVDENDQLLGFFIEWIRLFSKKFEKVTVLCLEEGSLALPDNVRAISLGKDKGAGKLRQFLNFQFSIFNLRNNYDAVFVHMNPIWVVLGGWWWRLTGKKIFFWYTSGGVTAKLKLAEKFADTIFTASKESFRLPSKKVIVTGHGIDTELFKPDFSRSNLDRRTPRFDLGGIKILSVGRVSPVKNYETLINAAKILKDGGVNFSVTMVGETALDSDVRYLASLKFRIKSLKLEENFSFIGKINHKELPKYYQSHDIFVHLSKTGSLDKTILEAMACGCNVLSSNDSSRKFLKDESVFKEDDPEELAGKIKNLCGAGCRREFRDYVLENHDLDKLISKIYATVNDSR